METENNKTKEIKSKLLPWLERKLPDARNLTIPEMKKPGMGLSNETYIFDLEWEESGQRKSSAKVLRAAPQGHKVFPEYELTHQFRIMKNLKETNVPVANVLWMEEDTSVIGAPFFIMDKLEGEVPQDYPSYHGSGMFFEATPEQRQKMWWGSLEAMANVHKLDWEHLGFSFLGVPGGGTGPLDRQLIYWDRYFSWVKETPNELHPTLEAAMNWLKENRYEPEHVALCWGDARMGNTLYDKQNRDVLAVMDWEMAYIGDPESDLAWFLLLDWQHSGGTGLPRCEGTPEYEDTVSRYEELTGWKVKNLLYNEVMAAVRYGKILVSVIKNFKKQGISIDEDMILNNVCTQRLSELLNLPSPGPKKTQTANLSETTVSVQFHFTGPGGYDFYVVSDKGKGTRHDGAIDNPTCTITSSLKDWKAIQSGELNRMEAWTSGKLAIEGDLNIMIQLEEMISQFTK